MKSTIVVLMVCLGYGVSAQEWTEHKSIHQIESENHLYLQNDLTLSSQQTAVIAPLVPKTAALARKVFGYHPYWVSSTAYLSYNYTALSTIGYFSYDVDTASGGYTSINGWSGTPIISYAHQRGVKVVLVVTNFGAAKNTTLLSDTVKQNTLIASLIFLLESQKGDGVNIDFEAVGSSQRENLVSFMAKLASRTREKIPGAEISMAAPAVDWSNAWDFNRLGQICDYLVIMGYDYYWSGSTTAGPVAPLEGESYNITRTVNTYITAGVPANKILLGVPWYGYDWPVSSSARKSSALGTGSSAMYKDAEPRALLNGKTFDATTKVPWYNYQSGSQLRQVWYDDSLSLALKTQFALSKNLGGLGIWALSFEGGRQELWKSMIQSFGFMPVSTFSIKPRRAVIDTLQTIQISPTGRDSLGNIVTIDSSAIQWWYVGTGGSIQQNGRFAASRSGSGWIYAQLSGKKDSAFVTIIRGAGEYLLDSFSSLQPWTFSSEGLDSGGVQITKSTVTASHKDTSLRIDYSFHYAGSSLHRVYLSCNLPIAGQADSILLDIYGDGGGHMLEFRLKDMNDNYFYSSIPFRQRVLWKDMWSSVSASLKGIGSGFTPPAVLDRITIFLTAQNVIPGQACTGTLYIDNVRSAFMNNSPRFLTDPDSIAYVDSLYRYAVRVDDAEGDSVRLKLYSGPVWLHLDTLTWILSGIPRLADVGKTTVYLQAYDGKSSPVFQSFDLNVKKSTVGVRKDAAGIKDFLLTQNYPNPFNSTSVIRFSVPRTEFVTLTMFDLLGREVSQLVQGSYEAGEYTLRINGDSFPTGAYFLVMNAGQYHKIQKIILLR